MTLALFIAVGLGAGVALLLVHFKQPVSAQSSTRPEPKEAQNPQDQSLAAATEEEEMLDVSMSEETYPEDKVSNKKTRRQSVSRIRNSETGALRPAPTPVPEKVAPVKPFLVDRAKVNANRPDLFRIREIFVGSRPR
jgi:hypothetical protein